MVKVMKEEKKGREKRKTPQDLDQSSEMVGLFDHENLLNHR